MTNHCISDVTTSTIDYLCTSNGISRAELGRVLRISRSAMSQKMTGKSEFTLRQIRLIADYFDVSIDYLLGRAPLVVGQ